MHGNQPPSPGSGNTDVPPAQLRLIYASRPTPRLTRVELSDLVLRSIRRNGELGVTGMLWYHPRLVVQLLEGPSDAVQRLYAVIREDERHTAVTLLNEMSGLEVPRLSRWGLKLVPVDAGESIASIETWLMQSTGMALRLPSELATAVPRPKPSGLWGRLCRWLWCGSSKK